MSYLNCVIINAFIAFGKDFYKPSNALFLMKLQLCHIFMMSRAQLMQYATIFQAYVTTKVSNLRTCGTVIKIANTVTNLLCTVEIP